MQSVFFSRYARSLTVVAISPAKCFFLSALACVLESYSDKILVWAQLSHLTFRVSVGYYTFEFSRFQYECCRCCTTCEDLLGFIASSLLDIELLLRTFCIGNEIKRNFLYFFQFFIYLDFFCIIFQFLLSSRSFHFNSYSIHFTFFESHRIRDILCVYKQWKKNGGARKHNKFGIYVKC